MQSNLDDTFGRAAATTSALFNAPDADVVFRSSDDVLFHVHRINLQVNSGGFPPADCGTFGEVVKIPEASSALERLFRFIYPRLLPDLDELTFEDLYPLVEAAEKYEVYYAIQVCKTRIVQFLPAHAEEIMVYASRHDHADIILRVAPILICKPLTQIVQKLPIHLVKPWIFYYDCWKTVAEKAASKRLDLIEEMSIDYTNCEGHPNCRWCGERLWLHDRAKSFLKEININFLFELDQKSLENWVCCDKILKRHLLPWHQDVLKMIDEIPKFTTFL